MSYFLRSCGLVSPPRHKDESRGDPAPDDGVTTRVYTGTMLNPGDEARHLLFTLPSHTGSVVELRILAQDLNSNTSWVYHGSKTYWSRSWSLAPSKTDLGIPTMAGTDSFIVTQVAEGNDIVVKLRYAGGISTNIAYKIISKVLSVR